MSVDKTRFLSGLALLEEALLSATAMVKTVKSAASIGELERASNHRIDFTRREIDLKTGGDKKGKGEGMI